MSGCTEYVVGRLIYEAAFPEGRVCCDFCDFCRSENAGTRFRCSMTAEILPFHNKSIGLRCPLTIDQNKKENDE